MPILKHCLMSLVIVLGLTRPALAQGLDRVTACFVYGDRIGNYGWTYQHHRGAEALRSAFGERVAVEWQESVDTAEAAELVLEQMAGSGCTIIFVTDDALAEVTDQVAARFPEVKFELAGRIASARANLSTYSARFHEGRAVQGLLAGRMTRTNRIGFIAPAPTPEVLAGINAFYLNARRVIPNVELQVVWTAARLDPPAEARAAEALIAAGVDVLAQATYSGAPLEVAAGTGGAVVGFGQASDMFQFEPSPRISALVDNWAPYYFRRVNALLTGGYVAGEAWEGLGSGVVLIGQISSEVPMVIRAEAEALRDAIAAGTYHPFTGPINRQDGTPWLAAGERPSDSEILAMDFLVQGIAGALPQ